MRLIRISTLILAAAFLCGGCKSTLCLDSTKHLQRFNGGTQPVQVTNPDVHPEYEILKASGIYRISAEPKGARKLTLRPIHRYGRCGNPIVLTLLTFGIVPGFLPGACVFEYDLETDGVMKRYGHPLPVYERISIWESLVRSNDQKVLAEALAWSKRENQPKREVSGAPH